MNICFLCNEYPPCLTGGIGNFTKELSYELIKNKHKVIIVGLYDNIDEDIVENIDGVEIHRLKRNKNIILNFYKIRREIRRINKKDKIDIIETQDYSGLGFYLFKMNIFTVIRLHGSRVYFNNEYKINNLERKNFLYNILWFFVESIALKQANRIISVSNYTSSETQKLFKLKEKPVVIYNGVLSLDSYKKKEIKPINNHLNLVFYGSLIEKKGIFVLINVIKELVDSNYSIKLHIYGKKMSTNIDDYLELPFIIYHGAVSKTELMQDLSNYDAAIFPSFTEAFSLAPIEAMSSGLLVINSCLSSGLELFTENDKCGLVINPMNPESLRSAILSLFEMTDKEIAEFCHNASSLVEDKYSVAKVAKENIEFYESCISR